ncbi:MAG: hypothetical protein PHH16_01575 [Candidatus Gracilibacteria bacterium]|nr:hypothetical protein [Candidatus Gracilibacteria bacterium]
MLPIYYYFLPKKSRVFIEVIPFGGSIDDTCLTYYVRDELAESIRIGCLVEVPFRNAVDYAIITSLESSDIPENPKSIVRIITPLPLLAPYQIRSIFESSSYYFVHVHHILSLFLSKSLVKYLEKKDFVALKIPPSPSGRGSGGGLGEKKESSTNSIRFYHHTGNDTFSDVIRNHIDGRTIVAFPDDFAIDAYLKLHPINPETTLVIPDKLTETKKYKAFCSVYNGEKNIIIGTRRILYYNLSHYENILYIEDSLHSKAMRFGHSYKHLDILQRMATNSDFRITILSTLPSIGSMYMLHTGVYKKL